MIKYSIFLFILGSSSYAAKINTLKSVIKSRCGDQEISKEKIIGLVRRTYLNCQPEETIQISSRCSIKCLRQNIGNIIAKRSQY